MVRVSKKTEKKKNSEQNSGPEQNPDTHGRFADEDEEEEDSSGADEDVSGEEEDGEDDRKRRKLLEAISALGGQRKKPLAERSEAAVNMSEFTVSAEGEAGRMELSDLIGTIQTAPGMTAQNRKQLRGLERSRRTIECPLSKQDSERIQRDLAFQKAASAVSRWGSIITQSRRAEQLVFPLNQEPSGPRPVEKVVMCWKAQTPLEQEIFSLLAANKQPINDPILTPTEEASLRAMSLEDAKIRRAELQKARALQSYYEAKARRERKIKSKKYHKVQNKAKRKDFLKQFDEMVKSDPAAAVEELNKMELARMQERMSLKHQNSGKWAKSKAIMAKYDEEARRAMQQQLEVNKDLTQKMVTSLNQGEEEEEEEEGAADMEKLPDFVNDAEKGRDSNPWMRGKLSEEPKEEETSGGAKEVEKEAGPTAGGDEEEEEEEGEEEVLLREFDNKRKLRQEADKAAGAFVEKEGMGAEEEEMEEELSEFTKLFKGKTKSLKETEATEEATTAQLEEGLMRIRTMEDMELLSQDNLVTTPAAEIPPATEHPPAAEIPPATEHPPATEQPPLRNRKRKKKGIELKEVLTKETKVLHVPLCPTVEDSEEKVNQRGLIREAFAGDDVISDFLMDKRKQEELGKPKRVDLMLPGWGEWGGLGVKPSKAKRRRFRFRTAAPPPRRDQHLPSVIVSEQRNSSLSLHQVNSLPFPFQNHAQFESSIRSPLGRTWNTERTVKKVTKPRVLTQLGAIIQPMTEEDLERDKEKMSAGKSRRPESRPTRRK